MLWKMNNENSKIRLGEALSKIKPSSYNHYQDLQLFDFLDASSFAASVSASSLAKNRIPPITMIGEHAIEIFAKARR